MIEIPFCCQACKSEDDLKRIIIDPRVTINSPHVALSFVLCKQCRDDLAKQLEAYHEGFDDGYDLGYEEAREEDGH